ILKSTFRRYRFSFMERDQGWIVYPQRPFPYGTAMQPKGAGHHFQGHFLYYFDLGYPKATQGLVGLWANGRNLLYGQGGEESLFHALDNVNLVIGLGFPGRYFGGHLVGGHPYGNR